MVSYNVVDRVRCSSSNLMSLTPRGEIESPTRKNCGQIIWIREGVKYYGADFVAYPTTLKLSFAENAVPNLFAPKVLLDYLRPR